MLIGVVTIGIQCTVLGASLKNDIIGLRKVQNKAAGKIKWLKYLPMRRYCGIFWLRRASSTDSLKSIRQIHFQMSLSEDNNMKFLGCSVPPLCRLSGASGWLLLDVKCLSRWITSLFQQGSYVSRRFSDKDTEKIPKNSLAWMTSLLRAVKVGGLRNC